METLEDGMIRINVLWNLCPIFKLSRFLGNEQALGCMFVSVLYWQLMEAKITCHTFDCHTLAGILNSFTPPSEVHFFFLRHALQNCYKNV